MEMRQGYAAINGTQLISSWLDQGTRWCSFTDSPGIAVFLTINLRLSLSAAKSFATTCAALENPTCLLSSRIATMMI